MKYVFVVDIDGTVCDSSAIIDQMTGRFHKTIDSWDDGQMLACIEEACRQPVVSGAEVLPLLIQSGRCDVVFLTGRAEGLGESPDISRRLTVEWLRGTFGMPENVPLFMRAKNDNRTNDLAKLDVFEQQVMPQHPYSAFVFLDDDTKVLAAYAKHGLTLKSPECWGALSHFLPK